MSRRTPRPRRQRGAAESLGSIVLAFESVVVFLAGLQGRLLMREARAQERDNGRREDER
mgnify:CR=1 FL=1